MHINIDREVSSDLERFGIHTPNVKYSLHLILEDESRRFDRFFFGIFFLLSPFPVITLEAEHEFIPNYAVWIKGCHIHVHALVFPHDHAIFPILCRHRSVRMSNPCPHRNVD
jgi:hypothetical protein